MRFQFGWMVMAVVVLTGNAAGAELLTADRAVQVALEKNTQVIGAQAGILDARGRLYSSYSGILPSVSAQISRAASRTTRADGTTSFGGQTLPRSVRDEVGYGTTPTLTGTWTVLSLSALQNMSAARNNVKAAHFTNSSTRQDVAFSTRQQFYEVVKSIRLAEVASSALKLARDDERRVRALFEVGSVSRSDLLKAQVRTAQAQLDSLRASQTVTNQRITLAQILGVAEGTMGEVDTALTFTAIPVDEAAIRAEAAAARPDLKAADADADAARGSLRAAQFARLPALTTSASMDFDPKSTFTRRNYIQSVAGRDSAFTFDSGSQKSDRAWRAQIAITMPIFNGMLNESRIASAQAAERRARDRRDALHRNLDAQVQQAVLVYNQAVVQNEVAAQATASAEENLKLTQQKYNVGSSTILDLIDAQVQLQRAQSDAVSALAGIRVAEAQLDRVRGRSQ